MAIKNDNTVYIALGSNVGNRFYNIKDAIFRLAEKIKILEISTIEETDPAGFSAQEKFLNCVVKGSTDFPCREVFSLCKELEREMGRRPNFQNGPRVIDLDLLLYNEEVVDSADLKIPHPRLHERKFVLKPLSELSPHLLHPTIKKTVSELLIELGK